MACQPKLASTALTIAVAVSVEVAAWWSGLRSFHGAAPSLVIAEANLGVLVTIWAAANRAFIGLGISQIAAAVLAVAISIPPTARSVTAA